MPLTTPTQGAPGKAAEATSWGLGRRSIERVQYSERAGSADRLTRAKGCLSFLTPVAEPMTSTPLDAARVVSSSRPPGGAQRRRLASIPPEGAEAAGATALPAPLFSSLAGTRLVSALTVEGHRDGAKGCRVGASQLERPRNERKLVNLVPCQFL